MLTLSIFLCLGLSLAIAGAILLPFFRIDSGDSHLAVTAESSALNDQRERCIQVIRDLELDLATGKLTSEEYTRMRSSVGQELLSIVDKQKGLASVS